MIKIEKTYLIEVLELNPSYLIGKEILLKGTGENFESSEEQSVIIKDVNLKCTHLFIESTTSGWLKWISVERLPDNIIFDNFNMNDIQKVTVLSIANIINKIKAI